MKKKMEKQLMGECYRAARHGNIVFSLAVLLLPASEDSRPFATFATPRSVPARSAQPRTKSKRELLAEKVRRAAPQGR